MSRSSSWSMVVPPAPCDNCHKRRVCRVDELACPSYVEYVREGEPDLASTTPTKANYDMVYSGRFLAEQDHGA
jgi:hypothetical protein